MKPRFLETVVTAKRDKAAALKFLKRIMKRYGRPKSVGPMAVTYLAALKEIGITGRHEVGRRLNGGRRIHIGHFDEKATDQDRWRAAVTATDALAKRMRKPAFQGRSDAAPDKIPRYRIRAPPPQRTVPPCEHRLRACPRL
jgi:transposase-like protein